MLQPRSRNSTASQSRSSPWTGYSLWTPKSSDVLTIPAPKECCHIRLTCTRAVSGCSGMTSQRASPRRLAGAPSGIGRQERRGRERDLLPGLRYSPRVEDRRVPGLGVAHDHDARELIAAIVVELFPDGIELRQGGQLRGERRADLVVEVLAQSRVELLLLVVVAVVLGLAQERKPARPAGPSRRRACRRRRSPAASPRRPTRPRAFPRPRPAFIFASSSAIRALFSSVGSSTNGAATRIRAEKRWGVPLSGTRLKASSRL